MKNRDPLTGAELFEIAMNMEQSGEEFKWEKVDAFTLWSAVIRGDSTVAIGFNFDNARGLKNKPQLVDFLLNYTKTSVKYKGASNDLRKKDFRTINSIVIKVSDYKTIAKLRKLPFVRYVEPWGFTLESYMGSTGGKVASSSGCDLDHLESGGYTLLPGTQSVVSWHLTAHNVEGAWAYNTGEGTTIGVIDTGIDGNQELLTQSEFNWDPASPRTIELFNNANEDCAHGTTVTGMIAGPINSDYAITGVAHRASVKVYRAGEDVLLNKTSEIADLIDALEQFALDTDIRVINISMGYLIYKSTVWDALEVAKAAGKLVICAAGSTSIYGVGTGIYPAKHSNTIAVTGVKYDPVGDPNGTSLDTFGGNHKGSFVDFCTYLERSSGGTKALGMDKNHQGRIKAKGSSAAAALVSGVANLVWTQDPGLSRSEVINILKNAASIYMPYHQRDSQYGWGVIDAERALVLAEHGFINASITGPSVISQTGNRNWSANVSNAGGLVTYEWFWNGVSVGWSSNYSRNFLTISPATAQLRLEVTTSLGQHVVTSKTITITDGGSKGGNEIE